MIEKHTFNSLLEIVEKQNIGVSQLEQSLNCTFDNNFLTHTTDKLLCTIAESFFESEQLKNTDNQVSLETVKDILYHYAFVSDFGLKVSKLSRLYVEDEGLDTEKSYNAFTTDELYDLIVIYLHPKRVLKTSTLYC